MSARNQTAYRPLEALPAHRFLEGLSRIHRWMLVIDEDRRVLWKSEALDELPGLSALGIGEDARHFLARLPRPQQVFPLRSSLRDRSRLRGVPLELETAAGERLALDLDLLRLESDRGDLIVVVADKRAPEGEGPEAELLERLPDPVLSLDADGFVRRANAAACRLLGGGVDEIVARPVDALLADREETDGVLAGALCGPARDVRCEVRLRAGADRARTFDASVTPLRDGGRALVLRDVTAQRTALDRLARANEELEHSIGAVAHDLRSPLVGLLGFSGLLRQDYNDSLDDTGRHFVDRIERAARMMESLIHDLIELAKVGESDERPTLVDCHGVLRQLAADLKPRLEEARIELDLPPAGTSSLCCDRARLYQIFSNLIGNAIDHMGSPPAARIEVCVQESDEGHEIVVADNGRGVDPDQRERIFEIFHSVGKRSDGRVGTGMGLAIVKKIVERRGGRIWVESGPGGGASFHATLPRR